MTMAAVLNKVIITTNSEFKYNLNRSSVKVEYGAQTIIARYKKKNSYVYRVNLYARQENKNFKKNNGIISIGISLPKFNITMASLKMLPVWGVKFKNFTSYDAVLAEKLSSRL